MFNMDKPLLSRQAGKATAYIFRKKPSQYVPFKGEFPVVPDWRQTQFYELVHSHEYLEDCPEWMQTAVLRGEKMFNIETGFVDFLKSKDVFEKFHRMSAADKATLLVEFLNKNCLGLDRLKI